MFKYATLFIAHVLTILVANLFFASTAQSKPLPAPMTGAIILKLMELEAEAETSKDLNVLVINDASLAKYLLSKTGAKMGNRRLAKVWLDTVPANATPNIIYINSNKQLHKTIAYAKAIHALTISNDTSHVKDGIVLFIYDDEGLPGIAINISASKAMGYKWDPKILEISEAIQ